MFDIQLAIAKLETNGTDRLREKYPELGFVFDELDDLREQAGYSVSQDEFDELEREKTSIELRLDELRNRNGFFFIHGFDPYPKRAIMGWIKEDLDPYDSWGWCMGWLFNICGEMYNRNLETFSFGYDPGTGGPEIDETVAPGLKLCSDQCLEYTASVLNRYCEILRNRGDSY